MDKERINEINLILEKSYVDALADERIIKAYGYNEEEAKSILDEIIKDMDEVVKLIEDNRKDG